MRLVRIALAAALLFVSLTAQALTPGQRAVLFSGCPTAAQIGGQCPAGPSFNFASGIYWVPGQGQTSLSNLITVSRASSHLCQYANGAWISVGNNTACITDQGFLIEEARTNDALWARDLTNAAWVKVNMTTALNATGIDGATNSATTLTASAGNATVLQTITLGSGADTYSVFLKRVTGSGTINITENGGTAWTACTVTSTAVFTRCTLTSTLANPAFGIQIVTNGDSVIADFNQLEPGGFVTSPIYTTSTSATRAADVPQLIGAAASAALTAKAAFFQTQGSQTSTASRLMSYNGGAFMVFSTTTQVRVSNGTNNADATIGSGGTQSGAVKSAFGFDVTSMTSRANGGTQATSANAFTNNTGTVWIGDNGGGIRELNGYMQRFALSPVKGVFDGATSP